jgi:hypothetical protein
MEIALDLLQQQDGTIHISSRQRTVFHDSLFVCFFSRISNPSNFRIFKHSGFGGRLLVVPHKKANECDSADQRFPKDC